MAIVRERTAPYRRRRRETTADTEAQVRSSGTLGRRAARRCPECGDGLPTTRPRESATILAVHLGLLPDVINEPVRKADRLSLRPQPRRAPPVGRDQWTCALMSGRLDGTSCSVERVSTKPRR